MDPSTELANLEAENARRLDDLNRSGVDLEPGTFELMQITVYLESMMLWTVGEKGLQQAKLAFAEKASVAIDKLEQAAAKKARFGNRTNTRP
jgi:hypothetical protein